MTNSILNFALENKFGKDNAANILMLANLTINPSVAVEMMLGLYVQPKLVNAIDDSESRVERTFMKYFPLEEMVQYSYRDLESIYEHVNLKTGEILKIDNVVFTRGEYYAANRLDITKDEFKKLYTTTSIKAPSEKVFNAKMPVCDWK